MGYTHYWYRPLKVEPAKMKAIADDFNKLILPLSDMGVKLGNGLGEDVPVINVKEIYFNGLAKCGHPKNTNIVIPWPTLTASGVNKGEAIAGTWFAGTTLDTRTCDGDCSYETVGFPSDLSEESYKQESERHKGLYFSCCKTAFRPYDVAVTAFLIIAKHHLGEQLYVSSDGEDQHWQDGKMLCYVHLGYGPEFEMTNEDGLQLRKEKIA
jgi:hypothetical protein